ncbi:hypothetical protein pdam_00010583 [Pocillopora damicornis]|uniref:Uncharacterized protein n=1 Tax=Pocillopora damicornis TaxID=46731 RepID=A0A3M6UUD0_POCDA|nr:hypothetical protein pdam_00010583 [Pocillopora damicornis]
MDDKEQTVVSDYNNNRIQVLAKNGTENGQFVRPSGLHIDRHDCLLVCDQESGRFQKFSLEGRFIGKCTTPGLENLNGVAEMPDGRILVTSTKSKETILAYKLEHCKFSFEALEYRAMKGLFVHCLESFSRLRRRHEDFLAGFYRSKAEKSVLDVF